MASSVTGTPQPPRMVQRAYQQQRVNGPAQRTWKKLSESHSSQLRLLSVRGPLRPSLARRRRGFYHGMAPRAGFFVTAEWQVGNGTMALETGAGDLIETAENPVLQAVAPQRKLTWRDRETRVGVLVQL